MERHEIKGKWINVERLDLKVHVHMLQECLMAGTMNKKWHLRLLSSSSDHCEEGHTLLTGGFGRGA